MCNRARGQLGERRSVRYTRSMSMHQEATGLLREVKAKLASAPQGELDLAWSETRIREALKLLARDEPKWISAAEAQRLLGVAWESTVLTRARAGLLRSRPIADGGIEVRLDDVLYRRMEAEGLLAIGGDEMTPEELRILKEGRGKNPWERDGGPPSS
jgi:hypothetical protein